MVKLHAKVSALDVAQISDITAIDLAIPLRDQFMLEVYCNLQNSDSKVITVRTTAFDAAQMMEVLSLTIFKKAITLEYQSS